MKCAVYSVQRTVISIQCAVYSIQCALYSVQCAVCSVQYTVCSVDHSRVVLRPPKVGSRSLIGTEEPEPRFSWLTMLTMEKTATRQKHHSARGNRVITENGGKSSRNLLLPRIVQGLIAEVIVRYANLTSLSISLSDTPYYYL